MTRAGGDATATPRTERAREFQQKIDALLGDLRGDPGDGDKLAGVARVAEDWIASDGLAAPTSSEREKRPVLAAWLVHLCPEGEVLHFGWRDGGVAGAIAARGASVVSHLDHPARAIAGAVLHGSDRLEFGTLGAATIERDSADLVVIETAGREPVIPPELVAAAVRPGGWLALLGDPAGVAFDGLPEAGRFELDPAAGVRPAAGGPADPGVVLFRRASRGRATTLTELIGRRTDDGPEEIALRQRAARVQESPIPAQALIDWVGGGTGNQFAHIGLMNFFQLIAYCGMRPEHRILEPGCGCGRNARYLGSFLDPERGAYEGFDIHEPAIRWAQENIGSVHPHVRFRFADLQNTNYNPDGSTRAEDYRFPYDTESFDLVFLPSVFTHMTREGFEHYLREIHRVLKPGGTLLSWHFLLDETARRLLADGKSDIPMRDFDEISMVKVLEDPCAAIAYDESYVLETYESLGLRPQALIHGLWSGRPPEGYRDYQDRILARKRATPD